MSLHSGLCATPRCQPLDPAPRPDERRCYEAGLRLAAYATVGVNIGYVRVAVGAGQGKVAKVSLHLLLCLWRHRSLRSRCLPTLRLDTSTHSLSASHAMPIPRFALYPDISELPCPPVSSCLRFSPTPYASPLIATAPTSGEIGAAAKSKSASGILTFTAAISPHIGSVGSAYNATENEVGAVGTKRAVGGLKRRTRGAAPYPVITYKSTL